MSCDFILMLLCSTIWMRLTRGQDYETCNGNGACNDASYICNNAVSCALICNGANSCQNYVYTCNTNGRCDVVCNNKYTCNNLTVISYGNSTLVSCTQTAGGTQGYGVCNDLELQCLGDNDNDPENNEQRSCALDCGSKNACIGASVSSSNVAVSKTTCSGGNSCDKAEVICNATAECLYDCSVNSTACDSSRYFCPYYATDPENYNYTKDCKCIGSNGVCDNVQTDIYYLYATDTPSNLPTVFPTENTNSPTNVPSMISLSPTGATIQPTGNTISPTNVPSTISLSPTALTTGPSNFPTLAPVPTVAPVPTMSTTINDMFLDDNITSNDTDINIGSGGLETSSSVLSSIDALSYNLFFAIIFLIGGVGLSYYLNKLRRSGFYEKNTPLSIIPLLLFICVWQFVSCLILGSNHTHFSDPNILASEFCLSTSIPINFYAVLSVMIVLNMYNKYPNMQKTSFKSITAGITCLSKNCAVDRYYNFVLSTYGIVFVIWIIITLALSGDNASNRDFNSAIIIIYCIFGLYFALIFLSTSLSYGQSRDVTCGKVHSCCNPCICVTLYNAHQEQSDPQYRSKKGFAKDDSPSKDKPHYWCIDLSTCSEMFEFDPLTHEVTWGILSGFCAFLMFMFYAALALNIGETDADAMRVCGLLFEIFLIFFVTILFHYIRPETVIHLDPRLKSLESDSILRHQPSMDLYVKTQSKPELESDNEVENSAQYTTIAASSLSYKRRKKEGETASDDTCCGCFGRRKYSRTQTLSSSENGSTSHIISKQRTIDEEDDEKAEIEYVTPGGPITTSDSITTEGKAMSGRTSLPPAGPPKRSPVSAAPPPLPERVSIQISSPSTTQSNISPNTNKNTDNGKRSSKKFKKRSKNENDASVIMSALQSQNTTTYNVDHRSQKQAKQLADPEASIFTKDKLERLKQDGVQYVEILDKSCKKQSEDKWNTAKIQSIMNDHQILVRYMHQNTDDVIDLNVDGARFRVKLFGHPEPWKLPMNGEFGIPQVLMDLLSKLLHPSIKGDATKGVFRKSADQNKLIHYRTALCQYRYDDYEYRLPSDMLRDKQDPEDAFDVHVLSALIKDWLRQYPDRILYLENEINEMNQDPDSDKNRLEQNLVDWLCFVTLFFADPDNGNQMDAKAMSIVIAPNLMGNSLSPADELKLTGKVNKEFSKLVQEHSSQENPIDDLFEALYDDQ